MLIGRDAELAVLDSLVVQAVTGSGVVVLLLCGEPGVGKTRLARRPGTVSPALASITESSAKEKVPDAVH